MCRTGRAGAGRVREGEGVGDHPVVPDYGGACISNVVPALLEPGTEAPPWFPAAALEADQVLLLVLDGLGWDQLQARRELAPTLCGMAGGPDRQRRPVHDRHRPHVHRHRASRRGSTAWSATGSRSTVRC